MPDNKPIKTNRETYMERVRTRFPDKEFPDDEAIFAQINEDYDGYDKQISEYRDRENSFAELFTSDPRSAAFLTNWRNGGDPAVELVRMFGEDFVEDLKDPAKQEELAKANKEFADRIATEQKYEAQYKQNIDETLKTIETIQQEKGYTDDEIDNAMNFLVGIMKDGILGKFTRESIQMAFDALNHDTDVAIAQKEGEVKGLNTKIEEKLRKAKKNDGTADLHGKNSVNNASQREAPDMGVLDRYDGSIQNIWERGGEKRRPVRN